MTPMTIPQAAPEASPAVITRLLTNGSGRCIPVALDVACVQLPIVNVCLIGKPNGGDRSWVLVDAGLNFSASSIRRAAAERLGANSRPAAIVLTHGHFDHVGALAELAEEWGVPIYAHPLELPYLTGRSSYPPPDPSVGGGAMSFFSTLYPRGPIDLGDRVRPLPTDGTVPAMPGWRWIHTPGHSAGHVSFFRESDRILVVGDAFVTTKQESMVGALFPVAPQVRRPPAYYTSDWQTARRSVENLTQLDPRIAIPGHGLPITGEVLRRGLATLVRDWERIAVPAHGRYIHQPALTNESGVVSVPPPVNDTRLGPLLGLSLAAVLGMWLLADRSSQG